MKTERTLTIVIGWIVAYFGSRFLPLPHSISTLLIGIGLTVWGCYLWTQIKNRHWAFMFWGIISPVGLLGISLLKNKSK